MALWFWFGCYTLCHLFSQQLAVVDAKDDLGHHYSLTTYARWTRKIPQLLIGSSVRPIYKI